MRALTRLPLVSITVALLCTGVSVLAWTVPHNVVRHAAEFRGISLFRPGETFLWRLPASAFLTHSIPDLLWTLVVCATVIFTLERRIGAPRVLAILLTGHFVSTIAADCFAEAEHLHRWLFARDFGSSSLVFAAVAALILITANRWLLLGLLIMFSVDVTINSSMTILEHMVAVLAGALTCLALAPQSVSAQLSWSRLVRRWATT